jgi:hypothetical protein
MVEKVAYLMATRKEGEKTAVGVVGGGETERPETGHPPSRSQFLIAHSI